MNLAQIRRMLRNGRIPLLRGGMAIPLAAASVTVTAAVALVTTAETVLATLAGISPPFSNPLIRLLGWAVITTGAGTTGVTLRFRRGTTITGTLAGIATTVTASAGANTLCVYAVEDTPGEVANQQYVWTAQQVAATANGSALQSELQAYAY